MEDDILDILSSTKPDDTNTEGSAPARLDFKFEETVIARIDSVIKKHVKLMAESSRLLVVGVYVYGILTIWIAICSVFMLSNAWERRCVVKAHLDVVCCFQIFHRF